LVSTQFLNDYILSYMVYYMTTVSVRLSEEERKELLKYGNLSESLREGLKLYLGRKKSEKLIRRLEVLQSSNPLKTSTAGELKLIRQDRNR
jgi:Arc/MetJ-type ribon-helix-helix transcriptional regulator